MKNKIIWLLAFTGASFAWCAPTDPQEAIAALEGKENIVPIAVIGSGPTGYAAAIPGARAGYYTVVFQGPKPGGELMDSAIVENWPGVSKQTGAESMNALEKQTSQFGVVLDPSSIIDVDFSSWPFTLTTGNGTVINALTVIIATGASQKKLGIENEDIYWGRGLFSCGLCDASFTKEKDAAVIGGGDIAIQRALQLAPLAKRVTLIVPESGLTATQSMQHKIKCCKNIKVLLNKTATKINGDGDVINSIELQDTLTNEISDFSAQSLFLSTGLTANVDLFKDILELDSYGCIKLKEGRTQETAIDGVMAAGNVADPRYRQVATVQGDGTKAGIDALKLLAKWGFDGPLRNSLQEKYYKPTFSQHSIKHIKSIPELKSVIASTKEPMLVEVYSPLCSHCKNMEGPIAQVAEQFKPGLKVYKLNKDKDKLYKAIQMYDVKLIPSFIVFMHGQEINRLEGEVTLEKLIEFAEESQAVATSKKRNLCEPVEAHYHQPLADDNEKSEENILEKVD